MKALFYVIGWGFFLAAAWFGYMAAMFVYGGTLLEKSGTPTDGISSLMSLWMFNGEAQLAVLSAIAAGVFLTGATIIETLERPRD